MRGYRAVAFRGPPAPLSLRGAVAQLGERPDSIGKVGGTTYDNRGPDSTNSLWSYVLVICTAKPDYRAFLHRLHQRHGPAFEGAQWGKVQCDKGGPTMDYRLPRVLQNRCGRTATRARDQVLEELCLLTRQIGTSSVAQLGERPDSIGKVGGPTALVIPSQ